MGNNVKGIIEAVKDDGGKKGKFGWQHRVGIMVDGQWYGNWLKKSAEDMGIEEGVLVSFTYTENGEYKNYDPKSLKIAAPAPKQDDEDEAPAKAAAPAKKPGGIDRNIARGQAVNNAVALFVNGKAASLEDGLKEAIRLHALAEAFFDALLVKAGNGVRVTESAAAPASATPEKPAAPSPKPAVAKKPPPKPVPVKAPDPEPEPVQAEDEPAFDDDLPF